MGLWESLWTIYAVVAGAAMIMTYREQRRTGNRSLVLRAAGLVACAAWPAVVPLVFAAAQQKVT